VNKYLALCLALGKRAHFLYDLDSLFGGNLRACVKSDGSVQSFLVTAGVGNDFGKYCGELESKLTAIIDRILNASKVPEILERLAAFLKGLGERSAWDGKKWAKARVSLLTAISRYKAEVESLTSKEDVAEIEGRLKQIVAALKQKNINLLPGGTLERYLPAFTGDPYELTDDAKRQAVMDEIEELAKATSESHLSIRYGELFTAVCNLPGKVTVDIEKILREYLSRYIHDLQVAVTSNPVWEIGQVQAHLNNVQKAAIKVFSVSDLVRGAHKEFTATVLITAMLGQKPRLVRVSHQTIAGMGDYKIEFA